LDRDFGVEKMSSNGAVPANVSISFYAGAIIFLIAILWTVVSTREFPPDEYKKFHADESETKHTGLKQIVADFAKMPKTMKQLGVVQFFSWFALFSMWVYTTPAVATHIYGLSAKDVSSEAYQDAGNWVGIIFGVYNGVSALYALMLPQIAKAIGRKLTHSLS
jgi:maltose/moltooligosaccharide transporter